MAELEHMGTRWTRQVKYIFILYILQNQQFALYFKYKTYQFKYSENEKWLFMSRKLMGKICIGQI